MFRKNYFITCMILSNDLSFKTGSPGNFFRPWKYFVPVGTVLQFDMVFLYVLISEQLNDIILLHNNVSNIFVLHFFW